MSEFHQQRVLLMFPPIRFCFGELSKNAGNAEKYKLIHQTQEEEVMCYHLAAAKCMIMIFYNVNLKKVNDT